MIMTIFYISNRIKWSSCDTVRGESSMRPWCSAKKSWGTTTWLVCRRLQPRGNETSSCYCVCPWTLTCTTFQWPKSAWQTELPPVFHASFPDGWLMGTLGMRGTDSTKLRSTISGCSGIIMMGKKLRRVSCVIAPSMGTGLQPKRGRRLFILDPYNTSMVWMNSAVMHLSCSEGD